MHWRCDAGKPKTSRKEQRKIARGGGPWASSRALLEWEIRLRRGGASGVEGSPGGSDGERIGYGSSESGVDSSWK